MSVPFSNTHLRVPRGFGTILEGLAREVLRDQPEDIPKYAAQHFDALLRQREESGMDPAEWAAKLEDRFYNNHAFKASAGEESYITKKQIISLQKEPSEEESDDRLPAQDKQPGELSETKEEEAQTIIPFDTVDSAANEKDGSSLLDHDTHDSELDATDSFKGVSNLDVCAQELGLAEDGDIKESAGEEKETEDLDKQEKAEIEDPEEVPPFSGVADVDICAEELGRIEKTTEGDTAKDDTLFIETKSSAPQPERTGEESSLSESESPRGNLPKAEDQAEITEEEKEDTGDTLRGIHESLAHMGGGNASPKEDSLVEISFEDVPEAQQTKEDGEKQPEEEDSAEDLDTALSEMQQGEESEEVTAVEKDQNILCTGGHSEPEVLVIEEEGNTGDQDIKMQETSDTVKETAKTKDSDDEGDEVGKSNISSLQFTPESDEEKLEDENEENWQESEDKFSQHENFIKEMENSNDPDSKNSVTTGLLEGEEVGTQREDCSEDDQEVINDGAENISSQVLHSDILVDRESETFETKPQLLLKEIDESPTELTKSLPEDSAAELEVTLEEETSQTEEPEEEGKMDSCVQERSDAVCEESSISHTLSEEQLPHDHPGGEVQLESDKDTSEPKGNGSNKEECSRPQEEEDIMDIPLDDPEANRAAAKIQAGFRGHMTRKKMKPEDKTEGEEVSSTGEVLNGSQGDREGGSRAVERDDTSVPEQ
ncbi:Hypothetical predicted protein [Xyrichtys novacula]|uniref:RIIa domain-containing protein n=1 Tax=Xyrichtys novacula TaxID=13765 RepID=A0AAV1FX96_XYRNO|nr:Hypothetical predicted protein [Xyrichtys novacula]